MHTRIPNSHCFRVISGSILQKRESIAWERFAPIDRKPHTDGNPECGTCSPMSILQKNRPTLARWEPQIDAATLISHAGVTIQVVQLQS